MDREVVALSAVQHAAVARWQLAELGRDRSWVRHQVRRGDWTLATPRVLVRTGSPSTPEQRVMVAVLDAGAGAVASHRAAAWLWSLPGFDVAHVEVVRPNRPGGATAGGPHQPRLWLPHHTTTLRQVPVASLPVTLFQLAGSPLPAKRLTRLVHTVVGRSPATLPALHRTLDELAARGRDGVGAMRAILDDLPLGSRPAGSGTELRFEELLEEAGERPLERQADLGGHEWLGRFDYLDRPTGLIVEVQSDAYHTSPSDLAADDRRRAELLKAGATEVLYIWDDQIWRRPWEVVPAVRAARQRAMAVLVARSRPDGRDLTTRRAG